MTGGTPGDRGAAMKAIRAARLLQIRDLLDMHPAITGIQLADRLHCTTETIYRTVQPHPELHQRILSNNPVPAAVDGWVCGMASCSRCGPRRKANTALRRRGAAA